MVPGVLDGNEIVEPAVRVPEIPLPAPLAVALVKGDGVATTPVAPCGTSIRYQQLLAFENAASTMALPSVVALHTEIWPWLVELVVVKLKPGSADLSTVELTVFGAP